MKLIKTKKLKSPLSYVCFWIVILSLSLLDNHTSFMLKTTNNNTNHSFTIEAIKEVENQHIDSIFGKFERHNMKFFFRYNKLSCRACLESTISILKEATRDNNNELALIGDFINCNEQEYINRKLNGRVKIFEVKTSNDLLIDKFHFSYFFTINEDDVINRVFIPDKNSPNVTIDYLDDEFL